MRAKERHWSGRHSDAWQPAADTAIDCKRRTTADVRSDSALDLVWEPLRTNQYRCHDRVRAQKAGVHPTELRPQKRSASERSSTRLSPRSSRRVEARGCPGWL